LGIPIEYLAADCHQPFERWDSPELHRPEPDNSPLRALSVDQMTQIAARSRVAFYCEGPDNLLHYEWRPYVDYLVNNRHFGSLSADVVRYILIHRRLPLFGRLVNRLKWSVKADDDAAILPRWLNREFSRRSSLEQRWQAWQRGPLSDHPFRPKASASLQLPMWRSIFEHFDPGINGFAIETRHPFMDLRMVRYLLSVPPIPWCPDKQLVRLAMRGVLPEAVRVRPKAALAGDPIYELFKRRPDCRPSLLNMANNLGEYVDTTVLQREVGAPWTGPSSAWVNVRPFVLNSWLKEVRQ
jgi:asparagine synthase (glutamine-hydrolysing)